MKITSRPDVPRTSGQYGVDGLYSLHMLEIALTLAADDPAYEDMAIKYFEHFVSIASALNGMAGTLG